MRVENINYYQLPGKIIAQIVPERKPSPITKNPNLVDAEWDDVNLISLDKSFDAANPQFRIGSQDQTPQFIGLQRAREVIRHQEKPGVDETWIPVTEVGERFIESFEPIIVNGPLTPEEFDNCEEMFLGQAVEGLFFLAILNDGRTLCLSGSITGESEFFHGGKFDKPGFAVTTKHSVLK